MLRPLGVAAACAVAVIASSFIAHPVAAQTAAPAPAASVAPSPTPVPTPAHFVGSAVLGYTAASGNTTESTLSAALHAVRASSSNKFTGYVSTLNATGNGASTTARTAAGLRYDVNVSKKGFAFLSGDFLHNGLQHLEFGQLYGAGYGIHVIAQKTQTFDVFAGAGYTDNRFGSFFTSSGMFVPMESFTAPSALLGENYTQALSTSSNLLESLEYFPRLNGSGQSVANFNLGLNTALARSFTLNLALADEYTSNVTTPIKPNDLLVTTGLGYKFGN